MLFEPAGKQQLQLTRGLQMIYCVEVMNFRFIKIGFTASSDIQDRISQLQTGNPFRIMPVFFIDGTLRQEKSIHSALTTAFARAQITIPPNEWYPGRTTITKHLFQLILQEKGGINHAIAALDRYNPAVNQGGRSLQDSGYHSKKKWPSMTDNQWASDFGDYNCGKPPKLTNLKTSR